MIEGVMIEPLKIISDKRGMVMHMLKSDAPFFKRFGEIYFSMINPGFVKGWKKHKRTTQYFAVPVGDIKLVIYDDREGSVSQGRVEEVYIGIGNYRLVRIPPSVWYSFKALNSSCAIVANCTDGVHDPDESITIDINDKRVPYDWK